MYNNWRCHSSNLPQGRVEVPCTLRLSGDAKLGISCKLTATKNINIDGINLTLVSSTVNLSNFPLYGSYVCICSYKAIIRSS